MIRSKSVIGMVHVPALPGTPAHSHSMEEILQHCLYEALLLQSAGFDAIMLENMHDIPYLKGAVGSEIVAALTAVACTVKNAVSIPVGVQVLAGANKEALSVAKAANLDFIRAEGFVFAHVGDEGYHDSCAGELLRFRRYIGAENVSIYTDIKKKHSSHQLTADISVLDTAKAAAYFLSDGIIITGASTALPVDMNELMQLYNKLEIPVIIGSGITDENLPAYWPFASAFIVGSHLKEGGFWKNAMSKERIKDFMNVVNNLKMKDGL